MIVLDGTVGITTPTEQAATTIGVGNATPSTSGAGITFPATQSPSTNANTLDDYEEGTWTPVPTSNAGAITSYTSSGTYTKIGKCVTVGFSYTITNNGTGSSSGLISGLPFPVSLGSSTSSRAQATTGLATGHEATNNASQISVWRYDNTYPWATNATFAVSLAYVTT